MSETRRELLQNIGALTLTTLGVNVVSAQTAQHVHEAVAADKNPTHTIIALAWRTAEHLAEEMRKGNV